MKALSPRIQSLTVQPGFREFNLQEIPYGRGLLIDLTGGQSVQVVVTSTGLEQHGASEAEYTLVKPVVRHYRKYLLKGGDCPSAPAGLPTVHQHETPHEGGGLATVFLEETRESDRVKALRGIVKDQQARVVEGVLVDLFSAGTYLNVHGRINETNQAKFAAMDIVDAISKCYQVLAKAKANGK